jgi:hypothetical protein
LNLAYRFARVDPLVLGTSPYRCLSIALSYAFEKSEIFSVKTIVIDQTSLGAITATPGGLLGRKVEVKNEIWALPVLLYLDREGFYKRRRQPSTGTLIGSRGVCKPIADNPLVGRDCGPYGTNQMVSSGRKN